MNCKNDLHRWTTPAIGTVTVSPTSTGVARTTDAESTKHNDMIDTISFFKTILYLIFENLTILSCCKHDKQITCHTL